MKVVFRADASTLIGSGHVMRCLVLAQEFARRGHDVHFASRPQKGDYLDFIKSKALTLVPLKEPLENFSISHNDYENWLQTTWIDDAQDFLDKVKSGDIVVVDHYGIPKEWEKHVGQQLNADVLAIDDLVRQHNADFILDQTYGRINDEYSVNNPGSTLFCGSQYALLQSTFTKIRRNGGICQRPQDTIKVLVTMGAVDLPNVTLSVVKTLLKTQVNKMSVTVLLNKSAPHYEAVKSFCRECDNVNHLDFESNMAKLMSEHHIAVGAPGSTSWERACLGLPSILIPIADNQKDIAKNVSAAGAAIIVKMDNIDVDLPIAFNTILNNWPDFQEKGLALVDGLGTQRVVDAIEQNIGSE